MKQAIENLIHKTLTAYAHQKGFNPQDVTGYETVVSKDVAQGDFAANIAFKISRLVKMSPKLVADEFVKLLLEARDPAVHKAEVGGAGFINIYLPRGSLNAILQEVKKQDLHFGESNHGQGKKALVEFVSANPTGPLTIAHGRQAAVGDTLVRLLNAVGYKASAEYYLNDAGRQMNLLGQSLYSRYCQALGLDRPLPEDGYQGGYLKDMASKLASKKGDALTKDEAKGIDFCRNYAKQEIMQGILEDLKSVDVRFDQIFNETSLYENKSIEAAFEVLKSRGYLFEQDGALWFRSTDFGDDKDRVVRKSTGELTYIAPDIAYHRAKFQRGYEWIIDLMGPDHHGYISRLKAACAALGHNPNQVEVRIVQLSTLYRNGEPVRMSTRAGEFVTLNELVHEVGPDAARFFFLIRKVDSHLDFDLDLAKQKSQDNPVFYLQYAHARICSILRNAEQDVAVNADVELLNRKEEIDLIKKIYDYSQTLVQASDSLEPYRLVDFLRDLAASFHKFYAEHRVLTEDVELTRARLLLIDAVRIVMRNGLTLLGVSRPESM